MRMPSVGHAVKPVPEYVINSAPPSLEAAELSTSLTSNRYFVAGIRFSGYDAKLKGVFLNSQFCGFVNMDWNRFAVVCECIDWVGAL